MLMLGRSGPPTWEEAHAIMVEAAKAHEQERLSERMMAEAPYA